MRLNAIEYAIDAYLERSETAENYQNRIEDKYQQLRVDTDALREAESYVSGSFEENNDAETTLMMYEYYHNGMTSQVEHRLRTLSQERAALMDAQLYGMAEDAIHQENLEAASDYADMLTKMRNVV